MNPFPVVRLGDVLAATRDKVNVEPTDIYEIAGVLSFGRGVFGREAITGAQTKYEVLYKLKGAQLVVSRLKAFEGAIAVVPEEFGGSYVSQEFPTFDVIPGKCDPDYLRFLCRWPDLWDQLRHRSRGVGARRERVHEEDVLNLQVPLPPIDEQRHIAARLDRTYQLLARATAFHTRQRELLEALMPSVLRPVAEAKEGKCLHFGEDIEVASGGTPSTDEPDCWGGDVVWITPADLGRMRAREIIDSERHLTEEGVARSSARIVPPDSVVMSSRAPIGHLGIARVPLATNQGCKIFLPHPDVVPEYLYFTLRARMQEISKAGSGTTFTEISMKKLQEFSIYAPPVTRQLELVGKIASAANVIGELRSKWTQTKLILDGLKVSLLNEVFSN